MLVTCSRNVAVESIVRKLETMPGWPLCVFGSQDRVGVSARRHLLSEQVGYCFDDSRLQMVIEDASKHVIEVTMCIEAREALLKGCKHESVLKGFLREKYSILYGCKAFGENLLRYGSAAKDSPEWCATRTDIGKFRAIGRAKVVLCTIASTSTLLRECGHIFDGDSKIHTVIVDEAGCVTEAEMALLIRLQPKNVILVGDHRQLPPTTDVPVQAHLRTGHTRSMFERCVVASGEVKQLREQYRMHPGLAALVSMIFYDNMVVTP